MRTPMASHPLLADLVNWPDRWMRDDPDLATGREILRALEPFLAALAASSLSRRTLRRHLGNAFLLGGNSSMKSTGTRICALSTARSEAAVESDRSGPRRAARSQPRDSGPSCQPPEFLPETSVVGSARSSRSRCCSCFSLR